MKQSPKTPKVFKGVPPKAPTPHPNPAESSIPDGLWNFERSFKWLDVSRRFLGEEVRLGRIRHIKFGRAIRFHPADVRAYAAARAKGGLVPIDAKPPTPGGEIGGEHADHP